jgi:hypothetical protein
MEDPYFRASKSGKTTSQIASEAIDEQRKQGRATGTIIGLSKETEKYARYREHAIVTRANRMVAVRSEAGGGNADAAPKSAKAKKQ